MFFVYIATSQGWLTKRSFVAEHVGAGEMHLQPNESVWAVPGTLDPTEG